MYAYVDGLFAIDIGHVNIEIVILVVPYHQGCSIHGNEGKINRGSEGVWIQYVSVYFIGMISSFQVSVL